MLVHRVYAKIKKVLPNRAARLIRSGATGLLTPVYFSVRSGHFSSSLRTKAVDRKGNAIPWYTYPLIDLLLVKIFSDKTILEFGAGQSTVWWSQRAKNVLSFEGDQIWFDSLQSNLPTNVELHYVSNSDPKIVSVLGEKLFDVIIIDGLSRFNASKIALNHLNKRGVIIVDNSDGWSEGDYPIMTLFRNEGFSRVDFYGHTPGVMNPHCSSVFFRDSGFIFDGIENPVEMR